MPKTLYLKNDSEGAVTLNAAAEADGEKLPTFSMVAYTGGAMRLGWPSLPVVVDLAGMTFTSKSRPIFRDHDSSQIVGHTTSIEITGNSIVVKGIVSGGNEAANEVLTSAGNGFPWQASIGAEPTTPLTLIAKDEKTTVNGTDFVGPIYVAKKTVLKEISFVALGADDNTTARVAATAASQNTRSISMNFAEWLKAKGFDPETLTDGQRASLEAMYEKENGDNATDSDIESVIAPAKQRDERRKKIVAITRSLLEDYPEHIQVIEALGRQAQQGECWEADRFELAARRAIRPEVNARCRSREDDGVTETVIEAAVCMAGGLSGIGKQFSDQTLEAASKRWRHGLGLGELFSLFARRNGHDVLGTRNVASLLRAAFAEPKQPVLTAAVSTLSLPGILGNVANKFLRAGFDAVESSWRQIAAIRAVRDFRAVSSYALTGDFKYQQVAPGGELKHADVGEESYSNQVNTYGRMFGIDRQAIINDDLGALTDVPRKLGRGSALSLNELFWTKFLDNASFFTSGRNNYLSGATAGTNDSRLNLEGLTRAENAFFAQTDPDGNPLGSQPKILLVPVSLGSTAAQLMSSMEIRDTTSSTKYGVANPFAGKFTVVRSAYLNSSTISGASAAAWYLLADPIDVPVIEVAFLNGQDYPTVESGEADFSTLGIQFRGYHDVGVEKQEYRGGVKSKGEA